MATQSGPAGTPSAAGVERRRPRENGQRLGGGEWEERIDLSERIAWFGGIIEIEGPLVEIGCRSVYGNSAVGVRVASGGGSAHDLTPRAPEDGGAWGERIVASRQ